MQVPALDPDLIDFGDEPDPVERTAGQLVPRDFVSEPPTMEEVRRLLEGFRRRLRGERYNSGPFTWTHTAWDARGEQVFRCALRNVKVEIERGIYTSLGLV